MAALDEIPDLYALPAGYRTMTARRARVDPSVPVACYFVDDAGWPRGTLTAVVAAIRVVEDMTGLTFAFAPDGRPRETCTWLTFSVHDRRRDPMLKRTSSGYGGSTEGTAVQSAAWTTAGQVVLASDLVGGPTRKPLDKIAAVAIHKIGHALGLHHCGHGDSIMYERPTALLPSDLDRAAFAWLGAGPVLPRLRLQYPDDGRRA